MKKLTRILLVLSMLLSICISVFAEGQTDVLTEQEVSDQNSIQSDILTETEIKTAHDISKDTFPIYKGNENGGVDLTLYSLDDAKDLPYIEANDLL